MKRRSIVLLENVVIRSLWQIVSCHFSDVTDKKFREWQENLTVRFF